MYFPEYSFIKLLVTLAYLDPGSGSIIIQMLIAAILGGGILLRSFWHKIFGRKTKSEDDETDPPNENEGEEGEL